MAQAAADAGAALSARQVKAADDDQLRADRSLVAVQLLATGFELTCAKAATTQLPQPAGS